jgi:hypothetical protein
MAKKTRMSPERASKVSKGAGKSQQVVEPRRMVLQADFPSMTLQDAQRVAVGLIEEFGGQPTSPPDVALAIGISPSSSAWRVLTGGSIAYGLTDAGYNATRIGLTELGRRLVSPDEEGGDITARREAILRPRVMREFFGRYRRARFPSDQAALSVLRELGLPSDRSGEAVRILVENGRYAGIIREAGSGLFVNLDTTIIPGPSVTPSGDRLESGDAPTEPRPSIREDLPSTVPTPAPSSASPPRVFISHGKQRAVLGQIKELLTFGTFEPVVSIERESTAIPLPEKVFEDMRSCSAGVLHVNSEGEYLDRDGNKHLKINDNVLIEIGAAIALYGKRIVLLVERGVPLPSNLQGLYRCEYEGDDSTTTQR